MKLRFGPTREEATHALRLAFAELYNELRKRGHDVTVRYDEPGNPFYIPHLVEIDGLRSTELNVRFYIEPYTDAYDRGGSRVRVGLHPHERGPSFLQREGEEAHPAPHPEAAHGHGAG